MANLTGKQIAEQGIVTKLMRSENIQQHGVDLDLIRVQEVIGGGVVPLEGKTVLANRIDILPNIEGYWELTPGVYDITFAQGCCIPENQMGLIRQRSSLLRNGTLLHSSVFDAGFETNAIGTVMHVRVPIKIQQGARVAQFYVHESNIVTNLYDGQWQGDKQREEQK